MKKQKIQLLTSRDEHQSFKSAANLPLGNETTPFQNARKCCDVVSTNHRRSMHAACAMLEFIRSASTDTIDASIFKIIFKASLCNFENSNIYHINVSHLMFAYYVQQNTCWILVHIVILFFNWHRSKRVIGKRLLKLTQIPSKLSSFLKTLSKFKNILSCDEQEMDMGFSSRSVNATFSLGQTKK